MSSAEEQGEQSKIAASVVKLLHPKIVAAVEQVIKRGLEHIKKELSTHTQQIAESEARVSALEDELMETQATLTDLQRTTQDFNDKIDDLKNRCRRNNLRTVCVLESAQPQALLELSQQTLRLLLGIQHPCTVERAHRLGPSEPEHKTPPPSHSEISKLYRQSHTATSLQRTKKSFFGQQFPANIRRLFR